MWPVFGGERVCRAGVVPVVTNSVGPDCSVEVTGDPGDELIFLLVGAANRDPSVFPEPDRLDIRRPNTPKHISFGGGIHYCIGAAPARLEAQIAFEALTTRVTSLDLQEEPAWVPNMNLRGLQSLKLSVR